jgi:hypothetical protein
MVTNLYNAPSVLEAHPKAVDVTTRCLDIALTDHWHQ